VQLKTNNQVESPKWDQLLKRSAFSSPFQSFDFYNLYNSLPGRKADVFTIESDGNYSALAIVTVQKETGLKAFFSRRGIIYGGPLLAEENRETISLLFSGIETWYRGKLIYIEVRNYFDYSDHFHLLKGLRWRFVPYLNIKVVTEGKDIQQLIKGMKYNRRREIKISQEQGAVYCECTSMEELESFYSNLREMYSKRVKLPLPPFDFFRILWEKRIARVFLVRHENNLIGGSFCPVLEGKVIYTMYYYGLREYSKNIFPTHLAVLAALEYAVDHNCKYLDFMGAGLKGEKYGVRDYKLEFGGEIDEYGRYIRILNPVMYQIGKLGLKILSRIN
jgi:predicted N-acyltransferase